MTNFKKIGFAVGALILFVLILLMNPWSYNDPTERTVVTRLNGKQTTVFKSGVFYAGFFAKLQTWPNQLSVSYGDSTWEGDLSLRENTVEIGPVKIRFNDATEARVTGIVQYILPMSEKEMLAIHNAHKTPEALVQRRLAPYTKECLQSSSQLMSSEMHYSGGRAQMTQDYLDQLINGTYLLNINEATVFDSTDNTNKRVYSVMIKKNSNGLPLRKFSSIKEYSIALGDAQITNVDYSDQVKDMLSKKIEAATQASISKQRLMTAEQQKLTAKAEGEKKLTEIEYVQKQEQTKQVVIAQTQVELAKQDLAKQEIARQAAEKEAQKIKILADANAYQKRTEMQANGALEQKLAAWIKAQEFWAHAFGSYTGQLVPSIVSGAGPTPNGLNWMEIMTMKFSKDLALEMKNK